MRIRDRRLQFRGLISHWKRISEFRDTRECRCSTGILPVWPTRILPAEIPSYSRAGRVTSSSLGETPASPIDKMSVLLSFVTKFDLRRQDCITGMSRLADASVHLVVTSPPYNLGIRYRKYSDRQDRRSYLGWCGEWAGQVQRVLKSNGSFFLNIGAAPSNPMLPHEIVMELREFFVLQNTIHWIKSIAIDEHCSRRPGGDARRNAPSDPKRFRHGSGDRSSCVWPFQADQFAAISQ